MTQIRPLKESYHPASPQFPLVALLIHPIERKLPILMRTLVEESPPESIEESDLLLTYKIFMARSDYS